MTSTAVNRITAAVDELRRAAPVEPGHRGPMPLAAYYGETALDHVELPNLTRGLIAEHLQREGIRADDLGDAAQGLAGFVFVAAGFGWAFVNASEPVTRRRFTAAHELGHFLLHRDRMGLFRADTDETLQEAEGPIVDQMEQEANRFAVEVLMPTEICCGRAEELHRLSGCCPRGVLVYQLASELLVSRQAMRYRLDGLEVGDA